MKVSSPAFLLSTLVGVACAVVVSCRPAHAPANGAESDGSAETLAPDGGPGATEEGAPAAEGKQVPSADAGPPPLASVLVTDPADVQKIFDAASAAPKATTKPNGIAGPSPLAKGVRVLAKTAAPGMKADGPLAVGKLDEKKNQQTEVTLKPGKCYTVVGYATKITDLDLYLLLPPGILSGQDLTDDNKPVIGKAPDAMCPMAKSAVKYTLDIVADQGSGDFAVQLYSKVKEGKAAKKGK
jgi:hypothetical protein